MGVFDEVDRQIEAERGAAALPGAPGATPEDYDTRYGPAPASSPAPSQTVYKGGLLPFSRDAQGNVSFDPLNAGITGAFARAFTFPGRVKSGEVEVDPSNPKFIEETTNFAGAFGPAVNPAIRAGDRAIPGVARQSVDLRPVPSSEALLAKGGKQLDAWRDAPVRYNPEHAPMLAQRLEEALIKEGVFEHEAPGLYGAIARLRNNQRPAHDPNWLDEIVWGPAGLHSLRKNVANQFGKQTENQHGVGTAFRIVDDFIANPPAGAVMAGPAAAAAKVFEQGLGNYAAGMRSKGLEDIGRTADLRTSAAYSGLNADNTLRGRLASHVLDAAKVRGYTDAEKAALEAIPTGTWGNNLKRWGGNFLGGGGGLGAYLASGGAFGLGSLFGMGPGLSTVAGIAAPVAGAALKRSAGKSTRELLDEAAADMRRRSPLFREQPPMFTGPENVGRDRIARTLAIMEAQQGRGVPVDQPVIDDPRADQPLRITVTPRRGY